MSSAVVITIVVIVAIGWLAFLAVQALRSRGPEEVPPNLQPGQPDEVMETRRLERTQQAAVLLSAFLAVGLPLYYLGEPQRQEGFVEEFSEQSIERGLHLYEEFGCGGCHGPDGGGGVASYVEPRTGKQVQWAAPSINDVFYRYPRDIVRHWLVFGRQNSPMPAWGLDGGGPMNDAQIEDLLNYLQSEEFQISQEEVAAEVEPAIEAELAALEGAEAAMETQIIEQRQVIAEIERATRLVEDMEELSEQAEELEARLGEGLDTDGDGVADTAEQAVNELTAEARSLFVPGELAAFSLDPETADAEAVDEILEVMQSLVDSGEAPILAQTIQAVEQTLAGGGEAPAEDGEEAPAEDGEEAPAEDGEEGDGAPADTDGDGLTDAQEQQIAGQISSGIDALVPSSIQVTNLDPTNPETTAGVSDLQAARSALSGIRSVALNMRVTTDNLDRTLPPAEEALDNLLVLQQEKRWEFDFEGIADHAFDGDVEKAQRVVGLYQSQCARCHTSGYSAGIPFAQEAGSGGFGPALWQGRPAVQFSSDEQLAGFLEVGAVENEPYGVNGMGNGQMPGFGQILSEQDLADLSHWLREGNLTGQGDGGRSDG